MHFSLFRSFVRYQTSVRLSNSLHTFKPSSEFRAVLCLNIVCVCGVCVCFFVLFVLINVLCASVVCVVLCLIWCGICLFVCVCASVCVRYFPCVQVQTFVRSLDYLCVLDQNTTPSSDYLCFHKQTFLRSSDHSCVQDQHLVCSSAIRDFKCRLFCCHGYTLVRLSLFCAFIATPLWFPHRTLVRSSYYLCVHDQTYVSLSACTDICVWC